MPAARLDVRLDGERRRKLAEIAASRGLPISAAIRTMIDETYEVAQEAERRRAAKEIGELALETVPDPDVLSKQLEDSYAVAVLP